MLSPSPRAVGAQLRTLALSSASLVLCEERFKGRLRGLEEAGEGESSLVWPAMAWVVVRATWVVGLETSWGRDGAAGECDVEGRAARRPSWGRGGRGGGVPSREGEATDDERWVVEGEGEGKCECEAAGAAAEAGSCCALARSGESTLAGSGIETGRAVGCAVSCCRRGRAWDGFGAVPRHVIATGRVEVEVEVEPQHE